MITTIPIPLIPPLTNPLNILHPLAIHHPLESFLLLKNLNRKATGRMPCDMAVEQPRSWIICFERDDEISACWDECYVATGWVVPFEFDFARVEIGEVCSLG